MVYKGFDIYPGKRKLTDGREITGYVISGGGRCTIAQDLDIAKRFVDSITKRKGKKHGDKT